MKEQSLGDHSRLPLCGFVHCWTAKLAGKCLLVEVAETQEEHLWNFVLRRSDAQLQQEVFTLKAQVAAESGLADAVRAINNLASAQSQKDTPNLIDVKGLGRPTRLFWQRGGFAGVVQENRGFSSLE